MSGVSEAMTELHMLARILMFERLRSIIGSTLVEKKGR